jgi:GTPase
VVIGPGDSGVIFDWEPTIAAGRTIAQGPRGGDDRLAGA